MTLYELSEQFQDFQFLVESGEIPVEAMADTLEGIELEFENKADNIAAFIKNLNAEAAAIKQEETILKQRREQKEEQSLGLKEYLTNTMLELGKKKIETPRNKISFRKSVMVQIENEQDFMRQHPEFNRIKTTISIDKTAVKDVLKSELELKGAQLIEKQNLQVK